MVFFFLLIPRSPSQTAWRGPFAGAACVPVCDRLLPLSVVSDEHVSLNVTWSRVPVFSSEAPSWLRQLRLPKLLLMLCPRHQLWRLTFPTEVCDVASVTSWVRVRLRDVQLLQHRCFSVRAPFPAGMRVPLWGIGSPHYADGSLWVLPHPVSLFHILVPSICLK